MSHKILVSDPISEDGLQSILKHPEFVMNRLIFQKIARL